MSLVAAYGTAGTGVAISSLSGAAASNASLALVGGGFGVAGGTALMATGVGIAIVGVSAAVMYGFHAYDEQQDNIRLHKTIEYLSEKSTFVVPDVSRSNSQ